MTKLRVIAGGEPWPRYDGSLIEQVESNNEQKIDAHLRQRFGHGALALSSAEILVFESKGEKFAQQIDHKGSSVAVAYGGLRCVIARRPRLGRVSTLGVPEQLLVATFSTSHGILDLPESDYERMQNNDTGIASLFPEVAVAVDKPVKFSELADNRANEEPLPFGLYVVQ